MTKNDKKRSYVRIRADSGHHKRILVITAVLGILAFLPMVLQLYQLMITDYEYYAGLALRNQTRTTSVTAHRGTIYDRELFEMLRDAAEERDIPWQTKQMVAGGTDAGRIHKSGTGVRTVGLAAPLRYIHSPASVAALCDLDCVLALARAFLELIGEE